MLTKINKFGNKMVTTVKKCWPTLTNVYQFSQILTIFINWKQKIIDVYNNQQTVTNSRKCQQEFTVVNVC